MKSIFRLTLSAVLIAGFIAAGPLKGSKANAKTFTIKVASHQTSKSPHQWVIDEFKSRIEKATSGGIKVQVFSDGQLGNERENIEGVSLGSIQMCLADTGYVANLVPEYGLLTLPFIYRDYDHLNNVLKSDVVMDMDKLLIEKRGLRALGWYPDGLRDFITKDPVVKLEDFSGMKLRAMESDVVIATINALGANATPIPWGEVYTSLQTNVVSGMESAPTSIKAMRFYEQAKHFTLTEHINLGVTLLIGEKYYAKLPADYQEKIVTVMTEIVEEQKARTVEQMVKAVKEMENSGVTVHEIDKKPLVEAVQPVWKKFAGTINNGPGIIEKITSVQ
jgi:tripartite ATP-independent transporter DctP family solute receptor